MTRADNAHHLKRAAAARHDSAIGQARSAIDELDRSGDAITFTSVARAACVSRSWLYNQPDIRDAIIVLRRERPPHTAATPAAQRASTESLRQRLDSTRDEITRLRAENAELRERLAHSLGEQRLRR